MEKLLIIGDGSLLKGILTLPFAIYGLILFIKGAIANLDEVNEKYTFKKAWHASAYFLIFILSYMALVDAISKLL